MVVFATGNRGKFEQVSLVLAGYGVSLEQKALRLDEPVDSDLKGIALSKAKQAFGELRQPVIVEDTGFFLEAYNGFPGTRPKWVFEKLGFEGFLKLLSGKPKECYFHTVICFMSGLDSYKFFEGKWSGRIVSKVSNVKAPSLPYSRFFVGEGEKVPSVEMSPEERSKKSQRGIAAHKLGAWLKEKALHDMLDSI